MPTRPESHIIGDRAVSAVRRVWAEQGAAVEEIRRDYGEDLLVQTHLKGRMDGSRLWVQVKGTESSLNERALPTVRVNCGLALRWSRTSDLVVVVLWDTKNDVGWYSTPQDQFVQRNLLADISSTTSVSFTRSLPFNVVAAETLCWSARIRLANVELQRALQSAKDSEGISADDVAHFQGEAGQNIQGIMLDLKILSGPDEIHPQFTERVIQNVASGKYDGSGSEIVHQVVLSAVLQTFNSNAAGCPAPVSLLVNISDLVARAIFTMFPGIADI